jgi:FkbM family methyltransferase
MSATLQSGAQTPMALRSLVRGLLPRRHRPHTILGGPLRGLRIVTSWHDYPAAICGYTERKLIDWLLVHARPGETWLDVGANCGYTSLALCRRVGGDGWVYAFEPALPTAACLERTARENRFVQLVTMPLALSDAPGLCVERFATARGMIDSQMAPDDPDAIAQIVAVGLHAIWDSIAPPDPAIHGIKIDVQGMELEALLGMEQTLARYQPKLVLEIHRGVPRAEVLALLERCGYATEPTPIDETLGAFLDPQSNANFVFLPSPATGRQSRPAAEPSVVAVGS